VLETVFNGYSNGVYRGMWNLLEEFLAGIGWGGLGLLLWSRTRRFGQATAVLGLACLVDSIGTALNNDAIASAGLVVYLILGPVWACWAGILLIRDKAPFTPGNSGRRELSQESADAQAPALAVTPSGGRHE
jgi:hypothetical protein